LVFMAKNKQAYKVEFVAEELKLPKMHLRKIFRILSKEGILKSCKGRFGGFCLNVEPKDINMASIFKIFQGKIDLTNCVVQKDVCQRISDCLVREKLAQLSLKLEEELTKITLK